MKAGLEGHWEREPPCPVAVRSVQHAVSGTWPRLVQDGAQRGSAQECPSLRFGGPTCSLRPCLLGLLPWRGGGCWVVWGTGSPLGAVITPRQLWALRGRTAAPGLPPLSEARPQAGARRPSGRSFWQELQASLCSSQGFTWAAVLVRTSWLGWPCLGGGAGRCPVWPGLWLLPHGMGLRMRTHGRKAMRPTRASCPGPTRRTGL